MTRCKVCGQAVVAHPLAQLYQHVVGHVRAIDAQRKQWQAAAADADTDLADRADAGLDRATARLSKWHRWAQELKKVCQEKGIILPEDVE